MNTSIYENRANMETEIRFSEDADDTYVIHYQTKIHLHLAPCNTKTKRGAHVVDFQGKVAQIIPRSQSKIVQVGVLNVEDLMFEDIHAVLSEAEFPCAITFRIVDPVQRDQAALDSIASNVSLYNVDRKAFAQYLAGLNHSANNKFWAKFDSRVVTYDDEDLPPDELKSLIYCAIYYFYRTVNHDVVLQNSSEMEEVVNDICTGIYTCWPGNISQKNNGLAGNSIVSGEELHQTILVRADLYNIGNWLLEYYALKELSEKVNVKHQSKHQSLHNVVYVDCLKDESHWSEETSLDNTIDMEDFRTFVRTNKKKMWNYFSTRWNDGYPIKANQIRAVLHNVIMIYCHNSRVAVSPPKKAVREFVATWHFLIEDQSLQDGGLDEFGFFKICSVLCAQALH